MNRNAVSLWLFGVVIGGLALCLLTALGLGLLSLIDWAVAFGGAL